jgi:RNA polymerase sigma-70 factor, ECF subfamily
VSHYAGLISLFRRKVGNRELAEDLVNQAFVEALDKLAAHQIADPSRFSGFVYGVAFNLFRNHRRRMENRIGLRAANALLAGLACDASPSEQHHEDRVARQIRCIIEELPATCDKEVVRRFYLEEHCKSAICADMGLSPLRFDKILFRARRRLKVLLQAHGFERADFFYSAVSGFGPSMQSAARFGHMPDP